MHPPEIVENVPSREVSAATLAALRDAVAVMDAIRSEGGCAWAAQQTHASLARFAVEEAFELSAAIAEGQPEQIRDELGDVLMQVLFHARVAEEHASEPFSLEDVARTWIAKMRRRRPHIFDGTAETSLEDTHATWLRGRRAERPHPTGPLDGVPASMPPLERAQLFVHRCRRDGVDIPAASTPGAHDLSEEWGDRLLDAVVAGIDAGVDVSGALGAALERRAAGVQVAQGGGSATSV